jgi:hypothetical protein
MAGAAGPTLYRAIKTVISTVTQRSCTLHALTPVGANEPPRLLCDSFAFIPLERGIRLGVQAPDNNGGR